mmetsp:Transcript_85321/g.227515  ORF Transcript_85321/g.227515 Transcript_85321/m.227515 type:complete len:225 (+) Transcript_85321:167-841(+)
MPPHSASTPPLPSTDGFTAEEPEQAGAHVPTDPPPVLAQSTTCWHAHALLAHSLHIYIYMYICIISGPRNWRTLVHRPAYADVRIYPDLDVPHACLRISLCTYMYARISLCTYMDVRISLCTYMYILIYINIHIYGCMYIFVHADDAREPIPAMRAGRYHFMYLHIHNFFLIYIYIYPQAGRAGARPRHMYTSINIHTDIYLYIPAYAEEARELVPAKYTPLIY